MYEIRNSKKFEFLVGELHRDIWIDAVLMDVAIAGRKVFRNRDRHAGAIREAPNGLDQALTEGFLAHQNGTFVVL